MNDLSGKTTLVVGASRGLGRGIATAAADAGASVIAVARGATTFPEPATGGGSKPADTRQRPNRARTDARRPPARRRLAT